MNGYSFDGDYNDPTLLEANDGNDSYTYDPQWRVVDFGTNSLIRVNVWNNNTGPHPMHLHGHEYWVLNEGNGQWDGQTVINPQNPLRRDAQYLRPNGYMVLQYNADNPGVWPFHCHIAWYLSTGLSITLLERPAEIPRANIATVMDQTCAPWEAWTKTHVVDQIDDGL